MPRLCALLGYRLAFACDARIVAERNLPQSLLLRLLGLQQAEPGSVAENPGAGFSRVHLRAGQELLLFHVVGDGRSCGLALQSGYFDENGFNLTFTPTGSGQSMSFTGSNTFGCDISGTFTQEGTNNVFDVSMTIAGTVDCPITGSMTGLGFESSSD